jgi:hypothetical protein
VTWLLAHGIGGIRDLPVPRYVFFYGAAGVLVVSFVALAALWKKPVLAERAAGRPLPHVLQRMLLSTALRAVAGAGSFALLVFLWLGALIGENSSGVNFTPTFVYVYFWVGMVLVVALFGNVWSVLSPWCAAAEGAGWVMRRLGVHDEAPFEYPERLGRWPATVLLLSFTTLELTYVNPSNPHSLALAIAIYSALTWLGAAAFGTEAWFRNGDGFSVYFQLLARISPFGRREDGQLVVRTPFSALSISDPTPGTIAFVAVMLGSTFFDGFSRTSIWQNRYYDVQVHYLDNPTLADLLGQLMSVGGLILCVAFVGTAFRLAVGGTESIAGGRRRLSRDFIDSLIPIVFVYVIAHYFSLLLYQGEVGYRLLSDPWGRGWDLLGTHGFQPNFTFLTPHTIWYVQVAALVTGHIAGLAVAHDRAVGLFRSPRMALWTQYPMLVLMVLFTVGGLWVLSQG